MNVFSNYIPNKLITINDKDPPWMNDEIKNKIKKRRIFYQKLKKYKLNLTLNLMLWVNLHQSFSQLFLREEKNIIFNLLKKLNDPPKNARSYWFILKTIFNGRKIPVILPLLIDGRLVSDFKGKANRINESFSRRCNGSVCPSQLILYTNMIPQLSLMIRISSRLLEL